MPGRQVCGPSSALSAQPLPWSQICIQKPLFADPLFRIFLFWQLCGKLSLSMSVRLVSRFLYTIYCDPPFGCTLISFFIRGTVHHLTWSRCKCCITKCGKRVFFLTNPPQSNVHPVPGSTSSHDDKSSVFFLSAGKCVPRSLSLTLSLTSSMRFKLVPTTASSTHKPSSPGCLWSLHRRKRKDRPTHGPD